MQRKDIGQVTDFELRLARCLAGMDPWMDPFAGRLLWDENVRSVSYRSDAPAAYALDPEPPPGQRA